MIFYIVSLVILCMGIAQNSDVMIISAGMFAIASGIFNLGNNINKEK